MQPRIRLPFCAVGTYCWLMLSSSPTITELYMPLLSSAVSQHFLTIFVLLSLHHIHYALQNIRELEFALLTPLVLTGISYSLP